MKKTSGWFLLFAAIPLIAGCGDTSSTVTGLTDADLTSVVSAKSGSGFSGFSFATVIALVQADDAPPLETLEATFVAIAGERQTFKIRYDVPGETVGSSPDFFRLDLKQGSLFARPDGTPLAEGDTVLITVTVDPIDLRVEMEPSGLTFDPDEPAELSMWYARANPDLNGDGVVDADDSELANNQLMLWVRPGSSDQGATWQSLVSASHDTLIKRFRAEIEHFSGYVVAW